MDGHSSISAADLRVVNGDLEYIRWRGGGMPGIQVASWASRPLVARRPPEVIVAGRGCLSAWQELRAYAEKRGATVVCSMGGIGAMPTWHPLYLGMLGHTGGREANQAVANANTIIALGTRLDMRQTGTATNLWAGKYVIMVNEDQAELDQARVVLSEAYRMTVKEWLHVRYARSD